MNWERLRRARDGAERNPLKESASSSQPQQLPDREQDQQPDPAPDPRVAEFESLILGEARSEDQPPDVVRGGEIITWAPAVPGYMSHGLPGPMGATESPVDSMVAHGM